VDSPKRIISWASRCPFEPIIGHAKQDHRMGRNFLKGKDGDKINAILAGCGFNIRKLLRAILLWLFKERFRCGLGDLMSLLGILVAQTRPA